MNKKNNNRNRSAPRGYINKNVKVERKYKDKLFRSVFTDKKNLLSLYNALNGTSYKDEKLMEITTIENIIYIGMPNDVSVMIEENLQLYEHQSTWNPNMPVRGLFFFCEQYGKIIKKQKLDIYSKSAIKIPGPKYFVLNMIY